MAYRHERRERKYSKHRAAIDLEELILKAKRITKEETKRMIDEGKNPLIIDVRGRHDYVESDIKIAGSVRIPPSHIHDLIDELPRTRPIIIY